jgi:RNA polymerase sigma factor (sigma-70 family)
MGGCLAGAGTEERRTSPCLVGPYSRRTVTPLPRPAEEDQTLVSVRKRVLGYARKRLAPEDAEDLVQDALVLLVTKYAHVSDPTERVKVAAQIVANMTSSRWRRSGRRGERTAVDAADVPLEDGRPGPEELLAKRQLVDRLRSAVDRLRGRHREVLRLRLEDRTSQEIAEILGANLNTVYSWEHRCLKKLRELMGVEEVRR